MYPCREQIMSFFKIEDRRRNSVILTVSLVAVAFTCAIFYPDVLGLFGIFGGCFSASVGLIIPFLIKIRMLGIVFGVKKTRKKRKIGVVPPKYTYVYIIIGSGG